MKHLFIIILASIISIAVGVYAYKNFNSQYLIEEYYSAQNLDPDNEKSSESLRQKIQELMQKKIPVKYQPSSEKFQCFKMISKSEFFCTAETNNKKSADFIRKLLQETIPQELGWIPENEADEKFANLTEEIKTNNNLIQDMSEQLKTKNSKRQSEEKKFSRTHELYKKNLDLLQKKAEVLKMLIDKTSDPDEKENHQLSLEDTQTLIDSLSAEHQEFLDRNKKFSQQVEKREVLEQEISELKEKNNLKQIEADLIERTLDEPNEMGKVANASEFQLTADPAKHKFEAKNRPSNTIWFSVVTFFLLTNFVFWLRPKTLIPFEEDATMTEAAIK